ncbi:MAG TPA: ABC transporter permease [Alphaproteobacteria bacterium]|jgi:NitT/TauT family transport system permease protein
MAALAMHRRSGLRWGHGPTSPALVRLYVVLALLGAWELAGDFVNAMFIAPPSVVIAKGFASILSEPKVIRAVWTTFWELGVAFGLSVVFGVLIGLPIGLHRPTHRTAYPLVLLVYAVPQVTILPLFILWFGLGPPSKIAFGFSHGIFPILINVVAGVQHMRPVLMQSALSMGASRPQIFRHVILPHMVPSLFAGMRLAMTVTLLGVLLAEFYVSSAGIGYYAKLFAESLDSPSLYALIVLLAAMAVFFNELVRRGEMRFGRWRS